MLLQLHTWHSVMPFALGSVTISLLLWGLLGSSKRPKEVKQFHKTDSLTHEYFFYCEYHHLWPSSSLTPDCKTRLKLTSQSLNSNNSPLTLPQEKRLWFSFLWHLYHRELKDKKETLLWLFFLLGGCEAPELNKLEQQRFHKIHSSFPKPTQLWQLLSALVIPAHMCPRGILSSF